MSPIFLMDYSGNRVLRNTEHLGDGDLRYALFVELANLTNLIVVKFGGTVRYAVMILPTAFFEHVRVVVGLCAKKEMVRINARRVIAPMKNTQALFEISEGEAIGKDMSRRLLSSDLEAPVAVRVSRSGPKPTGFSLFDVVPKPLFGRAREVLNESCRRIAIFTKSLGVGRTKFARFYRLAAVGN